MSELKKHSKLLQEVKNAGQDFEWYPTTREIILAMYNDLLGKRVGEETYRASGRRFSMLDVGAGNCKVLSTMKEIMEEQPLLNEKYYDYIHERELFEQSKVIEVYDTEDYGRKFKCIINDGEEDIDKVVNLNQFKLMLGNCKIEDIDFSKLDFTKEGFRDTEKNLAIERISGHEFTYSHRSEHERLANRVEITKYMAIEKSSVLVDHMPKEALVVGGDFDENTLIDKSADIVFCNPPYSEYSKWSSRIIREANAKCIYLVIPQRWGGNKDIAQALKDRKAKVKIIGNFDFLEAEDRKARAYVSLVKIELNRYKYKGKSHNRRDNEMNIDPFDLWFEQTFKIQAEKANNDFFSSKGDKTEELRDTVEKELVSGRDLVSVLVQLYDKEMEKLIGNYMKLSELDAELFKELKVDIDSIKGSFKEKIIGLKFKYWEEIFSNLSEITKRLTRSTRDKLKNKLMSNASIDFNSSNIRSVVIWVLKHANHYYDEQMLELYDTFTTEEGIKLYKSNQHFVKDDFRYNRREGNLSKYALDYRIILHYYVSDWDKENGRMSDNQYENIRDVAVIGRNLGFSVNGEKFDTASGYHGCMEYGVKSNIYFHQPREILSKGTKTLDGKISEVFMHTDKPNENGERVMIKDGITYVYSDENESDWVQYKIGEAYLSEDSITLESDIFTTVRPYKNGNCHFQFNLKFIQKLNLEVGRIRGWLKDPFHAAEEMDISVEEAAEYWESSFTLLPQNIQTLLPNLGISTTQEESNSEIEVLESNEIADVILEDDEVLVDTDECINRDVFVDEPIDFDEETDAILEDDEVQVQNNAITIDCIDSDIAIVAQADDVNSEAHANGTLF